MLSGVDYVTTRRGTVVKITWTAPEVGVDITAEEHQRRINDFAQTWLNIVAEECQKLLNEGKPEEIAEKMVAGRINKYYKEICLEEQEFVKDSDMTV